VVPISTTAHQREPLEHEPLARNRSTAAAVVAVVRATVYALVALGLRFVMARDFFLAGQTKIAGPSFALALPGYGEFTVTLPAALRPSTLELFAKEYPGLPISPESAAYLVGYGEFALPLCLLLGFATRLSALALLVMTAVMLMYAPAATFWSTQVYVIAILSVLVVLGPGAVSADALLKAIYRT
jgi:putative oxidoreductase